MGASDINIGARLARSGLGYFPLIEDSDLPGVKAGHLQVDDPDLPTHVAWYAVTEIASLTGTNFNIVKGDTAFTSAGGAFITEAPAGKWVKLDVDRRWAEVSVVLYDGSLTLAELYQDTGGTFAAASVATLIPLWTVDIAYGLDGNPSTVTVTQYQSGTACTPVVNQLYWDADGNLLNVDRA